MRKYFNGTFRLIRFILRKERVTAVIWLLVLIILSPVVAAAYNNLFSTPEQLAAMTEMFRNPAMIAMLGPLSGGEGAITAGALFSCNMLLLTILAAAVMNIFFVVRHTRGDEEKGRIEVVRSLPVGRLSVLGAAMASAFMINLVLALFTGFALALTGAEGITFGGAMLYGAAIGVSGMLFAAVTAVFCQISQSARSATGISLGFLGLLYIIRAAGDVSGGALSMISPLGLILRVQCFIKNALWPVFVLLLISAAVTALALFLNSIRDTDRGLITERRGKPEASRLFKRPLGFAFRMSRNSMIAWVCALFVFGAVYGSVMGDMEAFIASNEFLSRILFPPPGHTQTEMFITMLISMMAVMSAIPAAGAMLRLAGEERQHRAENILSKAVPRPKIMSCYLLIAFAESIIMLLAAAAGLWSASAAVMNDPISLSSVLSSMTVYLPASWIIIGLAALLTGIVPDKAAAITYGYIGLSFFIIYLGRVLSFPGWTKYFTPFGYIPQLPVDAVNFLTLSLITIAAAAFAAGGYFFYRRRDLI